MGRALASFFSFGESKVLGSRELSRFFFRAPFICQSPSVKRRAWSFGSCRGAWVAVGEGTSPRG